MFSGVGPFAIECAKSHPNSKVVGMELNRQAHLSALENIRLNKVRNVTAICGDVKTIAKKYKRFADRIVMPLPKDSYNYLDSVAIAAKSPCIVHYYAFGKSTNAFKAHRGKIRKFFNERGKKVRFVFERTVRPYSPTEIEIVIDFSISDSARRG